ncbi:MAG: uncharacterized protein QOF79_2618 [Actinomycetota bacterium]|nr:uncharacterized protein [Actinomycetota bacterium]
MANRLAEAVSPYLRSHASNPVDWFPWGDEPFAEAERRQVPVLISIGYSTCHWCHVMARESFSDPVLAEHLNANFVAIKVDREEYPDVDSTYLAAASAFTEQLGWPLTIFATPTGRAFYAGTYFPPSPVQGLPSFRQVLDAISDAWTNHRDEVLGTAGRLVEALAAREIAQSGSLPGADEFAAIVSELQQFEDQEFGGFGGAPKFPVATTIGFLLDREDAGDGQAGALARRALDAMAVSGLRDKLEGGFFRYAVNRDWTEPHYERMLYDNALLLDAYARVGNREVAEGIASFLLTTMRLPSGGFASAQDSESTVDGVRVEGGYYSLDVVGRAKQSPPALDDKILTGWNGLAIGALASAGSRLGHPDWIAAAVGAADLVSTEPLVRARIGETTSSAKPTLEDYGMLAAALVDVALATGEARFAVRARELVQQSMAAANTVSFGVPGGADPVLAQRGLALDVDASEGAYPSGLSAMAGAAAKLALLTGNRVLDLAAISAMEFAAPLALPRPISFGAALGVMSRLAAPARQLVVVTEEPDDALASQARAWPEGVGLATVVTPGQAQAFAAAGFELYESRGLKNGLATAYLCEDFVCKLPVTSVEELTALL